MLGRLVRGVGSFLIPVRACLAAELGPSGTCACSIEQSLRRHTKVETRAAPENFATWSTPGVAACAVRPALALTRDSCE